MKCYLRNSHNEIRRVDKIKQIQSILPKDTDYSRRVLLCSQNNIPFQPYVLELNKQDFEGFMVSVGDCKPHHPITEYHVLDHTNVVVLKVMNNGK